MKVVRVPLDKLHEDPANARRHPDKNLAAVRASLARFGQQKPIVADAAGIVRAGNATYAAARELGWDKIDVVYTDLAGSEATAYAIADNRTAELAAWDDVALAETLRSLQSEDFNLIDVGYTDAEVDRMLGQLAGRIVAASAPSPAPVASLRAHPREYRRYPEDRLAHAAAGIRDFGFDRNVTVARDGTVLAGLDVVEAARRLGINEVPTVRLDLDPNDPRALKVLAGSDVAHLDEVDDRAFSELLVEVKDTAPGGLEGTGYDEKMLANLVFVTRPKSEVKDFDAAAHWVGMPEYEEGTRVLQLIVNFRDDGDRDEFVSRNGLVVDESKGGKSTWWPPRDKQDRKSILIEG